MGMHGQGMADGAHMMGGGGMMLIFGLVYLLIVGVFFWLFYRLVVGVETIAEKTEEQ